MHTRRHNTAITKATRLLVLSWAFTRVLSAQQVPTVTVCQVFEDLPLWSGKVISVHGEVTLGLEVFALHEATCPKRPSTEGINWPTAIWLSSSSFGQRSAPTDLPSVSFFSDVLRLLRNSFMRGNGSGRPPFRITATLVGVLRTSNSFGFVREENGRKFLYGGFGHLAAYPAELEYLAVKDIEISGLSRYSDPPKYSETK
jgi:hypothetical protein